MVFRKLIAGTAAIGAASGGFAYYKLRYVPIVNHRSQPLPPKRLTPVFATASEGVSVLPVPEGTSKFCFKLLVIRRMCVMIFKLIPIVWHLVLSLVKLGDKKKALPIKDQQTGEEVGVKIVDDEGQKQQEGEKKDPSMKSFSDNNDKKSREEGDFEFELATKVDPKSGEEEVQFNFTLCPPGFVCDEFVVFLKEMGPTYVKLGQWMATRPDIFPDELVSRLKELFDTVPAHAWSHTEKELKKSPELYEALENISHEPINSGSVAQVHTATLKRQVIVKPETVSSKEADPTPPSKRFEQPPYLVRRFESLLGLFGYHPVRDTQPVQDETVLPAGSKVVIKVLHPGTRELMLADIYAMHYAARWLSKIPGMDTFALDTTVSEFAALLLSQVDLRRECDNLLRFRHNFRLEPGITFPLPLPQYVSDSCLVETYESGVALQDSGVTKERNTELADLGCRMFLKMLFEDNFVHADLHPGNLLVRYRQPDGQVTLKRSKPLNDEACSLAWSGYVGVCDRLRRWGKFFLKPAMQQQSSSVGNNGTTNHNTMAGPGSGIMFNHQQTPTAAWSDTEQAELVVLDAGLITSLSPTDRENFIALFSAVACGDGELGAKLMMQRSPHSDCDDLPGFQKAMKRIFDQVGPNSLHGFSLGEIKMGEVLQDMLSTLRKYRVRIDGNFTTLVATVVVGEGLGRSMQPDYNIFGESVPYLITCLEQHELSYLIEALQRSYGPGALLNAARLS